MCNEERNLELTTQVSPGYDYFIFNDEDVQLKNVDNPSFFWKQGMNGNPWVRIEVLQLSIRLGRSLFTNFAFFLPCSKHF